MTLERITADPRQMGGVPCIRGLRVTVCTVLGQLAGGATVEQLFEDYPYLEREDVSAALVYAAPIVNGRQFDVAPQSRSRGALLVPGSLRPCG
jgi:uncharacterized protein (DUF433 family)